MADHFHRSAVHASSAKTCPGALPPFDLPGFAHCQAKRSGPYGHRFAGPRQHTPHPHRSGEKPYIRFHRRVVSGCDIEKPLPSLRPCEDHPGRVCLDRCSSDASLVLVMVQFRTLENNNRGYRAADSLKQRHTAMVLKVRFEPSDEGGYTVFVPALPGCISEG